MAFFLRTSESVSFRTRPYEYRAAIVDAKYGAVRLSYNFYGSNGSSEEASACIAASKVAPRNDDGSITRARGFLIAENYVNFPPAGSSRFGKPAIDTVQRCLN